MFRRHLPLERFVQHAVRWHSAVESGPTHLIRHPSPLRRPWMTRPVMVAIPIAAARKPDSQPQSRAYSVVAHPLHSTAERSVSKLATTSLVPTPPSSRFSARSLSLSHTMEGGPAADTPVTPVKSEDEQVDHSPAVANEGQARSNLDNMPIDPESDEDVPIEPEELQEALSRAPAVNSSYLPLPWKGRLGYVSTPALGSNCVSLSNRTCSP